MQLEEVGNFPLTVKDIKDKGSKSIVTFSDDSKLKLTNETIAEFGIVEDKVISKDEAIKLKGFEEKELIIKYLKSLVLKKPYTEKELMKKALLKFKNYYIVNEAIHDLKKLHLIDDEDFLNNYLDYFDKNNFGQYFIINFFKSNHLPENLIEKVRFNDDDEMRKAQNYFNSIKNKFVSNNFAKQKKKIYEKMLQRGFKIEIILDVLDNLKINEETEKKHLEKDYKKAKMKYYVTNDSKVDANSKIINKLIDKGYSLENINEIMENDNDFENQEEQLND